MQDDSNFKKLISKINVACVINTQHMHTYTRVTVLSLCVYHRRRKMLQVVGAEYRVARNHTHITSKPRPFLHYIGRGL